MIKCKLLTLPMMDEKKKHYDDDDDLEHTFYASTRISPKKEKKITMHFCQKAYLSRV